jgi:hypothetical protein
LYTKQTCPFFFPCCGSTKREKHILFSLVTDVILEQGCMQARFGLHSIKIENAGQGNPNQPGADAIIVGIANARAFKQAVLAAAMAKRNGHQVTVDLIRGAMENPSYSVGQPVHGGPVHGGVAMTQFANNALTPKLETTLDSLNTTMKRMADLMELQAQQCKV